MAVCFSNYTYTWSKDLKSKGPLDFIPMHTLNAGVMGKKDIAGFTLEGSLDGQWTSSRSYLDIESPIINYTNPQNSAWLRLTPPSYGRADLSAKVWYKKHVWLDLDVQNLFNNRIEETGGTLTTSRLISGKIGYSY